MAWYYYYGTEASNSIDLTDNYYYPSYYTNLYALGYGSSDSLSGGAYYDILYGMGGDDDLYGKGGNDYIDGGAGDDYIDGGTGYDSMYGGIGNDLYMVDSAYDMVYEYASEGTNDWVYSSVSYSLGSNVENLYVYGTAYYGVGNSLDNYIYGNTYDNYLDGGYGNDTVYGGSGNDTVYGYYGNDSLYGESGNDTVYGEYGDDYIDGGTGYDAMYGGSGNDTYVVDSIYDTVYEYASEGTNDWVYSSVSYTLGSNVENLYLTGTAYSGYGNSLDNDIYGNTYDNYIDGGTGYDAMYGGTGNDIYVVDSIYDTVTEYAGEGTGDWVSSSVSYTLGNNVENLYLTGTAYYGYGNSLNNDIYGNTYDNYLDSGAGNDTIYAGAGNDYIDGGTGYDAMYGGTGNDTYVVDSIYDTVTEYAGEGTGDWVSSSVSYTLGNNVENLYLTGTAYYGYGNSLNNDIYGNTYDNYLDSGAGNDTIYAGAGNDYIDGGTGYDAMYGGTGNDTYVVDSAYDTVYEYAGGGTNDWVYSSVSYTLGSNVENLYLTGTAYSGYGNSLDNDIYGNSSSNYLDGGAGNDYISGGYGNDIVVGGYGNDTVNGYGGGATEMDYLYGKTGGYNYGYTDADTYVLGDSYGAYYQDASVYGYSSYAVVMDYSYFEGDTIQLYGNSSNYAYGYANYGGTSATDTYIYSYSASAGYDLVSIVQDATTLNISYV